MDPRIAVIGIVRFPPDRVAEIRPHIRALVTATHAHDGCIAYDVAEDLFDAGLLRFSELWPDADSLARHTTAPHIAPWHAAAKACGQMEKRFHVMEVAATKTT
ncbi:MAG: antibiotic biosynthesis monooxygenase [Rhodoferax sp.]|nr:antibiotic biosynthesis monooxygenase [Rhodoferax sp.]